MLRAPLAACLLFGEAAAVTGAAAEHCWDMKPGYNAVARMVRAPHDERRELRVRPPLVNPAELRHASLADRVVVVAQRARADGSAPRGDGGDNFAIVSRSVGYPFLKHAWCVDTCIQKRRTPKPS